MPWWWFGDDRLLYDLKERNRKQESLNREEMELLRKNQAAQSERMSSDLNSFKRDLEGLRSRIDENNGKHEKELRDLRAQKERKAEELAARHAEELQTMRDASQEEKQRAEEDYQKRLAQQQTEHEAATTRAIAAMEAEKKEWTVKVKEIEEEQRALKKRKLEASVEHRKKLDEMAQKHRGDVDAYYGEMNQILQQQTEAAVARIAEDANQRLRMLETDSARVKRDAVAGMYQNMLREYCAIFSRARQLGDSVASLAEMIEPAGVEGFPYELKELESNYTNDSILMRKQVENLERRIVTNFSISKNFEVALMAPLRFLEESKSIVKDVHSKLLVAKIKNSMSSLESVKTSLEKYREVLDKTIADMKLVELKQFIENSLEDTSIKAIEN